MFTELMDRFVEFPAAWLWLVLLAAWRALPILVIVVGIGLALRRRLSPSLHAMLLTMVIVRLLLPMSVGCPLSLHKPIDNWFSSSSDPASDQNKPMTGRDRTYGLLPYVNYVDANGDGTHTEPQAAALAFSWEETFLACILFAIVSVSICMLIRSVVSHIRFALKLRSCRLLDQQPLFDLLLRECDLLAVGRRPVVREVPALAAPAVFGVFRKTICLPPNLIETLSEQELRWVIRHELAHIRRHDIPLVIMASLVSAFHWFNPVVWVVVSRLRAAMEAAADQLALKTLSQRDVSAYGNLLLRLAENSVATRKSPTLGLISFASGKHLKQRVELLMRDRHATGPLIRILIGGLVATIAVAGLTDAKDAIEELPDLHLITGDVIAPQLQPLWNDPFNARESVGPTFVEQHDIGSIFETMPKSLTDSNMSPQQQLASWLPLSPSLKGKLHVEGKFLSADLTARQHQLLRHMLEIWKHGEPKQICIEAKLIQTNVKTASSIDWAGRKIDGLTVHGPGPAIAARINESELAQLVRTASEDRRVNILSAPKVTVFDGQTAGIADQVQRPFVTGVDPKADGILQPVISIVDEGLSFLLTPKAGDDDSVTLAFEVKASSIGKVSYANLPIRASMNTEPQFTVQVPATEQYTVSSSVKLSAGESVVVAIPRVFDNEPGADSETTVIVALTPRILDTVGSAGVIESNY